MLRKAAFLPLVVAFVSGCSSVPPGNWDGGARYSSALVPGENPIFVPEMDREFLWNQIVDAVDDHFQIEHEQRMQDINGFVTEGSIETRPTTGSTIFEPWRGDSTWGFQRCYATLQSIRRRASVRVTPTQGGYLVGLAVATELEDLAQPERATSTTLLVPYETTMEGARAPMRVPAGTLGWIPMGRDTSLEQKVLADIRDRVGAFATAVPAPAAAP
jgi:hypothetical protein